MLDKICINKMVFNNLKPTKTFFKNKNNKFSAKGCLGEKKVKIFEVFDSGQGNLMEFISKNEQLSHYFPKLITYNEEFVVEEWVDGKTLKELNPNLKRKIPQTEEIKHVINLLWSLNYKNQVFDYLQYIHERLNIKSKNDLSFLPIRVNHNDLSLDNIILNSQGLKIIDNEFLGCNTGWILNIKNSFIKDDFSYDDYVSTDTLSELWRVRKEWSKFSSKNKKWSLYELVKKIL